MIALSYVKLVAMALLVVATSAATVPVPPCVQVNPNTKLRKIGSDLTFKHIDPKKPGFIGMELSQANNQLPGGRGWRYGNMVFKAEALTQHGNTETTISINKNGNPPPAPTVDGYFTVTYYNLKGGIIRSFYISHKDTCMFSVNTAAYYELNPANFNPETGVKLSQYIP